MQYLKWRMSSWNSLKRLKETSRNPFSYILQYLFGKKLPFLSNGENTTHCVKSTQWNRLLCHWHYCGQFFTHSKRHKVLFYIICRIKDFIEICGKDIFRMAKRKGRNKCINYTFNRTKCAVQISFVVLKMTGIKRKSIHLSNLSKL